MTNFEIFKTHCPYGLHPQFLEIIRILSVSLDLCKLSYILC